LIFLSFDILALAEECELGEWIVGVEVDSAVALLDVFLLNFLHGQVEVLHDFLLAVLLLLVVAREELAVLAYVESAEVLHLRFTPLHAVDACVHVEVDHAAVGGVERFEAGEKVA